MTEVVKRIKIKVKNLPPLSLPTSTGELIIETDASDKAWGGVLLERIGNKE